eukprot:GHVR01064887.1.p1 GENE.GHVR01064887.1~~GHVR01064887.1.p1  ORF type:complete len:374 (-),score=32.87 GHVR01064887.1:21-1142(-)
MGKSKDVNPRFRRSKEEIAAGLTPKQAIAARGTTPEEIVQETKKQAGDVVYKPIVDPGGLSYIPVEEDQKDQAPAGLNAIDTAKIVNQVSAAVFPQVATHLNKALDEFNTKLSQIKPQKVIAGIKVNDAPVVKVDGLHPAIPQAIGLIKQGITPLFVGPSGCGKTVIAQQLNTALGFTEDQFSFICMSEGVSEAWLFGRYTQQGYVTAGFVERYEFGGVFLCDEIDASDPNLLLAINTALANGHLYNPMTGKMIKRHKSFVFVAAANTMGGGADFVYNGRSRLDGATRDRFDIIPIDYLAEIEEKISQHADVLNLVRGLRAHVRKHKASEIVSYRAIQKGDARKNLGETIQAIQDALTITWAPELKNTFKRGA